MRQIVFVGENLGWSHSWTELGEGRKGCHLNLKQFLGKRFKSRSENQMCPALESKDVGVSQLYPSTPYEMFITPRAAHNRFSNYPHFTS